MPAPGPSSFPRSSVNCSIGRTSELHPVLRSAVVHCEIETIHPFADGNGRLGRLWQTLILARWNQAFASLPMEAVVFANRPQYYEALRTSQRDNDATAFVEFSLGSILATIEEVLVTYGTSSTSGGVGVNVGASVGAKLPEAVLALLRRTPDLTAAAIADVLGKSVRTIERHLKSLQESGRLRREGPDKTGHWVVIDQ